MTRRELLASLGSIAAGSVVTTKIVEAAVGEGGVLAAQALPLTSVAGVDRVVMLKGKTYLNGWVGYGQPPRPGRGGRGTATPPPDPSGPPPPARWTKVSGPGTVIFADQNSARTTATFSAPGDYVLRVAATVGAASAESTLTVKVELPPPASPLVPVVTRPYAVVNPMWTSRLKAIIVRWIPHCIDQCNRTDLVQGPGSGAGGIDNFVEAGKALRGEPHGRHKGYVFSNAWVHQTVESMCLALMVDAQGDREILAAQESMRATLEDWISKILSAQHPDGYLQTAFTLRNALSPGETYPAGGRGPWTDRWSPSHRSNHEGYVAGYFIESAINHHVMTGGKDLRLYNAAKRLADCWSDHIGPPPKQEWFDGHQEMEQALVRFGRFVNEVEARDRTDSSGRGRPGDKYIALAKFLLDCRAAGGEYDQSHLPVVQQYEAVGHAVRAMYTYSGMADVAVETRDTDYQSAVKSLWDNIVHRKYYLTGGVGSGESSEGFGPNYSLRNNSYCETCSSCGEVFFQWKMHLAWHDAQYASLLEQTLYNALAGSLDFEGRNFYYDNPLDARVARYPWHSVPCCVGNLSRTMLMLPTWMYSTGPDAIQVNLFVGSRVTIANVAGTDVELVQTTDYPWNGRVSIAVRPRAAKRFTLRIRVPQHDVSSLYSATPPVPSALNEVMVNGRRVTAAMANGYAAITRTWMGGDRVEFELPLTPQYVRASDRIEATRDRIALRRGPLVYNIEQVDQEITQRVDTNAPLATEWRPDLLGGITVIKGRFAGGAPFMAIPNFVRVNRNPPALPSPTAPPPAAGAPAPRPAPPPPTSIVWLRST
ncbi:MAG: glycoside hydrolase family 127 protein [Acidobacteriota bacterium]